MISIPLQTRFTLKTVSLIAQYNFVFNNNGKLLDLVNYNSSYSVERSVDPFVNADGHHPALHIISVWNAGTSFKINFPHNKNNSPYNFRRTDFPILYNLIASIDWQYL